jgi:hypothetical protein
MSLVSERFRPGMLYFACCAWWLRYEGWPRLTDDRGVLICPRCGHWLVFQSQGPAVLTMQQPAVEQILADRPDLARLLTAETAEHVRQRPCCKGAWGDA